MLIIVNNNIIVINITIMTIIIAKVSLQRVPRRAGWPWCTAEVTTLHTAVGQQLGAK